jgi:hypothetical protein
MRACNATDESREIAVMASGASPVRWKRAPRMAA